MSEVKVTDNSDKVLTEMERKVRLALQAIGETAVGYASEDVPVDTGRLRNSLTYAIQDSQGLPNTYPKEKAQPQDYATHGNPKKGELYIGTNVEYAKQVEFIDRYKHETGKAHFLRDAATNHKNEYKAIVEAAMKTY